MFPESFGAQLWVWCKQWGFLGTAADTAVVSTGTSVFQSQTIVCAADEDCAVYCTHQYACRYATIQCPTDGVSTCEVFCDDRYQACQEAHVEAGASGALHLYCGTRRGCYQLTATVPKAVELYCYADEACHYAVLTAAAGVQAPSYAVVCDSYASSCHYLTLNATHVRGARMLWSCLDYQPCYDAQVKLGDDAAMTLVCDSRDACTHLDVVLGDNGTFYYEPDNQYGALGEYNSWASGSLLAGNQSTVVLNCTLDRACTGTSATVGDGSSLVVACTGPSSCASATFNGERADVVHVACQGALACSSGNVYCPFDSNVSRADCTVDCAGASADTCTNLDVFSEEGRASFVWKNCNNSGPTDETSCAGGKVFCDPQYFRNCSLTNAAHDDAWACTDPPHGWPQLTCADYVHDDGARPRRTPLRASGPLLFCDSLSPRCARLNPSTGGGAHLRHRGRPAGPPPHLCDQGVRSVLLCPRIVLRGETRALGSVRAAARCGSLRTWWDPSTQCLTVPLPHDSVVLDRQTAKPAEHFLGVPNENG